MQFTVPQFIEKETKIVGPLTFKQFIYIGLAGGLVIFCYFVFPFHIFLIASAVFMGTGVALALGKVQGIPLPTVLKNMVIFLFKPKVYLWKKKFAPPKLTKLENFSKKRPHEEIATDESPVKIIQKSKLNALYRIFTTKK